MLTVLSLVLLALSQTALSQNWSINASTIRPWESYLQLGEIQRPLGLALNRTSSAHYHFYVGYLALHSFMYDTAQDAFDLATTNVSGTPLVEAYIGKLLSCKQALWNYTDFTCARTINTAFNSLSQTTTPFQRELMRIVNLWYANESYVALGENNFLDAIRNFSVSYPNETDIQVLYGLSLLNVADQIEYQNITEPPRMVESRTVLKAAYVNESLHPGPLHYLIHAYDVVSVSVAEQGRQYANAYADLVKTSSHGQHMPAHIWMRVGDWRLAANSDRTGILVSYTLCAIKARNQLMSTITSLDLSSIWSQANQSTTFIQCDQENRAHSMEWLAYTSMQTGDWNTCFGLIRDLYMSHNATTTTMHYLPFAYRTQARTTIDLFYWFPYKTQFFNRTNQLLTLFGSQNVSLTSGNGTRSSQIWSEAGFRMGECLRILSAGNLTTTQTSLINDHLTRLTQLYNMATGLNQYISGSIGIMPIQIRGIQAYVNESWQECLNQLTAAVEREKQVIPDANSPTLGFARSAELLAIHLLLIHGKSTGSAKTERASVPSTLVLNNQTVPITDFPSRALSLYQAANSTAPNRAISLLGMAQAYTKMQNNAEAARLYNLLKTQLSLGNTTDTTFLQEVQNSLNQLPSAADARFSLRALLTVLSMLFVLHHFSI